MATAGAEGLGPGRARGRATLNVGGAPDSQTHVHRTGLGPWSRSGHHAVPQRIHAVPQCIHMLRIMLCINMLRIMLCNDMPSHPAVQRHALAWAWPVVLLTCFEICGIWTGLGP